jgi:hypothetical protein
MHKDIKFIEFGIVELKLWFMQDISIYIQIWTCQILVVQKLIQIL